MKIRSAFSALVVCPLLSSTAGVSAQVADLPTQAEDGANSNSGIVVTADRAVTATKTDTPLIDIPQAISIIPAQLFEDRNAVNLQETLRYSAGVAPESYGTDDRADDAFVRGFEPAFFLDGMTRNLSYTGIVRIEPYLLDRVEILRGPASILYGRGSSGGIINALTKRPQFRTSGELIAQYGSFDRKQLDADLTGPLDDAGTLAGRFVGVFRDAKQQTNYIDDNRLLLAPSLTWHPGSATTVTLIGTYQRDLNGSSQQFLPIAATRAGGGLGIPIDRFLGEPDFERQLSRQGTVTALVDQKLTDRLVVHSRTRFARSYVALDTMNPAVYDDPRDPFVDPARRLVLRDFYSLRSHISTLTSDNDVEWDVTTGPFEHRILVGVDYLRFHERRALQRGKVAPIDVYDPVYGGPGAIPTLDLEPQPTATQTQLGLYLQDQIKFRDLATLVIGGRHDRAVNKTQGLADEVTKADTFRAGLIVTPLHGLAPYVSYSESFQPVAGLDLYGNRFKPQRGRQWETGIKWQATPAALLTFAAFDIEETNRPTADPTNPLNSVQTGKARSHGIELEGSYSLPGRITLTGAYGYVHAIVEESSYPYEVGHQLVEVPKNTASAWAMKVFPRGDDARLRLGTGVRYIGPVVSRGDGWTFKTPGYTLVDALAAIEVRRWSLTLRASNLFDKQYFSACRVYGDCFTGNGRNVIASLGYRF